MKKKTTKTKTNKPTTGTGATAKDAEFEANVLFQRIYGKWYAFSESADADADCLMTEVSEDEVIKRMPRVKGVA